MENIAIQTNKSIENTLIFGFAPQLATPVATSTDIATATLKQPRQRFTLHGSVALERQVGFICDTVLQGLRAVIPRKDLQAVMLGGGYGRGEGGVLRTRDGERPYNDLEFYVFTPGNRLIAERRLSKRLQELGVRLTARTGVEIEFKLMTFGTLRRSKPSMFYYDLMLGHRWLLGTDTLLEGCKHLRVPEAIPLHEATRLLFNRCSGLLFCAERLAREDFNAEESDFVQRNLAKACLAFGDVLLTARGQYHWSCVERMHRLRLVQDFPVALDGEVLLRYHAEGVAFKLRPYRSTETRDELLKRFEIVKALAGKLWLWIESLRLGHTFATPCDYALNATDKCPETSALRNQLVNARAFGLRRIVSHDSCRYPRQRLFHALSLLLWESHTLTQQSLLIQVQEELFTARSDFAGLVKAYERMWHRFN